MRTSLFLILMCGAHSAAAAELRILVYNAAALPSATLAQSTRVAQDVLSKAGIGTSWNEGDPQEAEAKYVDWTPGNCTEHLRFDQLRIRLSRDTPASVPSTQLGLALPCAAHGVQASIFADHVLTLIEPSFPSTASVLGYAMAHEIGHVLLRSTAHSTEGLMKARWSKSDWEAASRGGLVFAPEEAAQMAWSLSARVGVIPPHPRGQAEHSRLALSGR